MKKVVDPTYLACQHHLYMTVAVSLMVVENRGAKSKTQNDAVDVAVIGLGGGGLCTYIHDTLKSVLIWF